MGKPVAIPNTFATQFGNVPASQLDSDYSSLANAINDLMTYSNFGADSGSANSYVINFSGSLTVAYTSGLQVLFLAANTNTGASTLNVNSLGAIPILRPDGSTLQAGDIVANKIYNVIYNANGYWQLAFTQTPTTVNFLGIIVISSTETGPGIDNYNRIQSALDQAGVYAVMLQGPGPFRTSQPLSINRPSVRLYSESEGVYSSFQTTIEYIGVATASPVLAIAHNMHGCAIQGISINAAGLADIALWLRVNDGGATHSLKLHDLHLEGYVTTGLVIGKNSTGVIGTGQMDNLDMQRIYLGGGSAGTTGILLNAQNCEWMCIKSLFCSPADYAGNTHLHHIFAYAGGVNVMGMVSTFASDYGIVTQGSQVVIAGWRAEDRYVFQSLAVGLEGPCILTGITIRGSTVLPGDLTIDFGASSTSQLVLKAVQSKGSVNIKNSAPLGIDASVLFTAVGADFVLPGPQQWFGRLMNLTTGVITTRGSETFTSDVTVGGNLGVTGFLTLQSNFNAGTPAAITAHAGGGQASATAVVATNTAISVAATTGDSIKLPSATGSGRWMYVHCDDVVAASIDVFPQTGQALNNLGANNAFTMNKNTSNIWMDRALGNWVSV